METRQCASVHVLQFFSISNHTVVPSFIHTIFAAKAQKEEIQKKKDKDKKEKTKVEFVTGLARKPQVQAPHVTSTTGVPPLMPTTQATGQGGYHAGL